LDGAGDGGVRRPGAGRAGRGSGIAHRRMSLAVVGISHRTAPVGVRERLAYSRAQVPGVLRRLVGSGTSGEAVLLSTCNRTELSFTADDTAQAEAAVRALLEEQWNEPEPLASFLYSREGRAAA